MPEPPDFDQIARQLITQHSWCGACMGTALGEAAIAEQLRQVWNARGEADRESMTRALVGEGCQPDGPYITMLASGFRRLDK